MQAEKEETAEAGQTPAGGGGNTKWLRVWSAPARTPSEKSQFAGGFGAEAARLILPTLPGATLRDVETALSPLAFYSKFGGTQDCVARPLVVDCLTEDASSVLSKCLGFWCPFDNVKERHRPF